MKRVAHGKPFDARRGTQSVSFPSALLTDLSRPTSSAVIQHAFMASSPYEQALEYLLEFCRIHWFSEGMKTECQPIHNMKVGKLGPFFPANGVDIELGQYIL
jgi:hypothetical protein